LLALAFGFFALSLEESRSGLVHAPPGRKRGLLVPTYGLRARSRRRLQSITPRTPTARYSRVPK
jgi:hypothetical protein